MVASPAYSDRAPQTGHTHDRQAYRITRFIHRGPWSSPPLELASPRVGIGAWIIRVDPGGSHGFVDDPDAHLLTQRR